MSVDPQRISVVTHAIKRLAVNLNLLGHAGTGEPLPLEAFANPCEEVYYGIIEPIESLEYWDATSVFDPATSEALANITSSLARFMADGEMTDQWSRAAFVASDPWRSLGQVAIELLGRNRWMMNPVEDDIQIRMDAASQAEAKRPEMEMTLALCRAEDAGRLDSLDCPHCGKQAVSVWYSQPVPGVYRTWFVCEACGFESRVQNSMRPQHFDAGRVRANLQERDVEVLRKRRFPAG